MMTPTISQMSPIAFMVREFIVGSASGQSPNDPKLSDGGGWRGPCMVGGKAAAEARAVTAVAVRCSAWLGAFAWLLIGAPTCLLPYLRQSSATAYCWEHLLRPSPVG